VQLTQSQFDPIRITDRLWIVPSWHQAPDAGAINIELDPGMAFGTGSHPTTRLCLEWLCEAVTPACSVLDYGCGSGILGIAAARLGAGDVLGIDIDDKAVEAARDNAERNQARLRLQHSAVPLGDTFDLVVANILTNPLCVLAPATCGAGRDQAAGWRCPVCSKPRRTRSSKRGRRSSRCMSAPPWTAGSASKDGAPGHDADPLPRLPDGVPAAPGAASCAARRGALRALLPSLQRARQHRRSARRCAASAPGTGAAAGAHRSAA